MSEFLSYLLSSFYKKKKICLRSWKNKFRLHCYFSLSLSFLSPLRSSLTSLWHARKLQSTWRREFNVNAMSGQLNIRSRYDVISNISDKCNLWRWLIRQPLWQLNVTLISVYCRAWHTWKTCSTIYIKSIIQKFGKTASRVCVCVGV